MDEYIFFINNSMLNDHNLQMMLMSGECIDMNLEEIEVLLESTRNRTESVSWESIHEVDSVLGTEGFLFAFVGSEFQFVDSCTSMAWDLEDFIIYIYLWNYTIINVEVFLVNSVEVTEWLELFDVVTINMVSLAISILEHCSQDVFIGVLDYWQCKIRVLSISLILYGAGCFFNSVRSSN